MTISPVQVERVAMSIYYVAFSRYGNRNDMGDPLPSPGWSWEKASPEQQDFCRDQARAAIATFLATLVRSEAAPA